jgi:hypothetical protein
MKIVIAKSELDKVFAYEKYKENDPCKQCGDDARYCCGCPTQTNYVKNLKALKTYDPKIDDMESIHKYVDTSIKIHRIIDTITRLQNELSDLQSQLDILQKDFIIEEME